eukprot:gene12196-13452_t
MEIKATSASLFANLHIWSTRKLLSQQANGSEDANKESKKQWAEGNFATFQVVELMDTFPVAAIKWKSTRHVQVLLSNGTLISITIGFNFADIERIFIDKSLVGKLTDQIHHAVIDELYMVFTFAEKSKIAFVYFSRRPTEKKETERLNTLEPKIALIDIPGPTGRAIDRCLSVNCRGDLVCVWWPSSSEAAWPWSPLAVDLGRINLVVFSVSSTQLEVLCHIHTDEDPISIEFSYNQANHLCSVESSQASNGKYSFKSCIYECNKYMVNKVTCISVPIKGIVIAQARSHREDKLLLACDDGALVLYDYHRQLTQTTKASFSAPCIIAWHPTDTIVVVASSRGDFQLFDMALASLALQLSSDIETPSNYCKISEHFLNVGKLDKISWACDYGFGPPLEAIGCYDDILFVFDRGPLCIIRLDLGVISNGRLGPVEIVSEYINHNQELEAVNFLNAMNWNTNGQLCFACLTLIMDYLFCLPFNLEREACIEDALGSFYAPSRTISDVIMGQFCDPISRLARRFFHHLLRHKRFEKAFLLAVDIGAKDLFMDIHYLASDMDNEPLGEAAKQRAMQIHNEDTHPNYILEGSDYSSDDAVRDHHQSINQEEHINNHNIPHSTTDGNVRPVEDLNQHIHRRHNHQSTRGGRKLGVTMESNIPEQNESTEMDVNQENKQLPQRNVKTRRRQPPHCPNMEIRIHGHCPNQKNFSVFAHQCNCMWHLQ